MDLETQYEELKNYFGEKNLVIEYFSGDESEMDGLDPMEMIKRMFCKVKITHQPSGITKTGTKSNKQIENAIYALSNLKTELSNKED